MLTFYYYIEKECLRTRALALETITNPAYGNNTQWVSWITFEFFAQPTDMHIYCAAAAVIIPTPNSLQNQVTAQDNTPVAREKE